MIDPTVRLRFGDIVVDRGAFRVTRNGRDLALEPKAVDVLVYLVDRPGRLVSKHELIAQVWQGTAVTDNALTRVIAQLRKALGDEARDARYIETIPTRGYRFIADLRPADGGAPPAGRGAGRGAPLLWIAGLLAIAAVAVALVRRSMPVGDTAPPEGAAGAPAQITFSQALDLFQDFAPDGRSLAYSSSRDGGFRIYVKPIASDGREIAVSAEDDQAVQPAWSPDGQYLAYHSLVHGGIWVVPATGGAARQVAEFGSHPSWSPDGSRMVFQSGPLVDFGPEAFGATQPSTIWIVNVAGGGLAPLTEPGSPPGGHAGPTWSPDGRRIVFASRAPGEGGLWSLDPASRALTAIDAGVDTPMDPAFAPDGRSLVFSTASDLWRLPIDPASGRAAGAPARFASSPVDALRHPAVAPDGRRVAYGLVSMASNLWSIGLSADGAGAGPPIPVTRDTSRRNTNPVFSPDGSLVAYQTDRAGTGDDIWVIGHDGSSPRRVTADPAIDVAPGWLRDPARLVYWSRRAPAGLWAFDLATGREALLHPLSDSAPGRRGLTNLPRISPDGARIAFTALSHGVVNIWTATARGGAETQLTFDREFAGFPSWSPDGDWIAYEIRRGDHTHVAVVPSAGGAPRVLTPEPGQSWPYGWSPDGGRIAYAALRDAVWNVWWVSRRDGARRQVTAYDAPSHYVRYPAWSPGGDLLVYEDGEIRSNVWTVGIGR